jgi:hypothetical protein
MSSTRVVGVSFLILALLAMLAIYPAFAAATGTVTFSVSQLGVADAATITVDDADINVLVPATNTQTGNWAGTGDTIFFSLHDSNGDSGESFASVAISDEIAGTPVVAQRAGGTTGLTDFSVGVFNKTTGRISTQYGGGSSFNGSLTWSYKLASKNTTTAQVTAPSDPSGVTVVLIETGTDTGIFQGRIALSSTASVDVAGTVPPTAATSSLDLILAVPVQTVTVKYNDASPAGVRIDTLVVEAETVTETSAPPTSTAGTIALSSTQLSPADALTITVEDADLSAFALETANLAGAWNSMGATVFLNLPDSLAQTGAGFGTGGAAGDAISGLPVITASTAGTPPDYSVSVFNSSTGRLAVQYGGGSAPGAAPLTFSYRLTGISTTTVDVTSPSDATGVAVVLAETGQGTGIFSGRLAISSTSSIDVAGAISLGAPTTSLDRILANLGEVVTVTYNDADPEGTAVASVVIATTTSSRARRAPLP